jgi:HlyD family secretion protein
VTELLGRGPSRRIARPRVVIVSFLVGMGAILALLGSVGPAALRGDQTTTVPDVRPNPGMPAGSAIHALAHLQPGAGLVTIGARPGARIEEIRVREGDEIKKGDLLAILEGHAQAERQLALAESQKKSADHQRSLQREKLALQRESYDRLKGARLDAAQRVSQINQQRLQETKDLFPKLGQVLEKDPKAKFDLDQTYFQIEIAAIKADLDLKELQAEQDLQPKQRALEDKGVADDSPDVEVLSRQIDLARAGLEQAEVHAPASGRVLELIAHPGEVSSGPLLALGDVSTMVAKAEVYQSDVPRLAIGDPAEVQVQGRAIAGKVARIGQVVGGNELKSLDPRALQDLRVVKVTVALDDAAKASHYVNMQVDVMIRPRPGTRE